MNVLEEKEMMVAEPPTTTATKSFNLKRCCSICLLNIFDD